MRVLSVGKIQLICQWRCYTSRLSIKCSSIRNFSKLKLWTHGKVEEKYKCKDKMPEGFSLIYNFPRTMWIVGSYHASQFFLIVAISMMLVWCFYPLARATEIEVNDRILPTISDSGIFFFWLYIFVTSTTMMKICRMLPLRIYICPENKIYHAYIVGKLRSLEVIQFEASSVKSALNWTVSHPLSEGLFKIHNRKVLLLSEKFRSIIDFQQMVKYANR